MRQWIDKNDFLDWQFYIRKGKWNLTRKMTGKLNKWKHTSTKSVWGQQWI